MIVRELLNLIGLQHQLVLEPAAMFRTGNHLAYSPMGSRTA